MDNKILITTDEFVDFIVAKTKIESICALVGSGEEYCSDTIRVLLGMWPEGKEKGDAGAD